MLSPYEGGRFKVTQQFKLGSHNGLDVVGLSSKNLIAMRDGVVWQSRIVTDHSDKTWEWGNYVTVKDDLTGALVVYAHLSKRLVKQGDRVKAGDVIGVEGNTGYSFGSHCHLEVRNADNKVTSGCNTPIFTGIPNMCGTYDATTGKTNEEIIFGYLTEKMGLNVAAACGVLANIQRESNFNPHDLGDNGTSYGICQWHASRWDRMKVYCDEHGYDWKELDGQLPYLEYELEAVYYQVLDKLRAVADTAQGAYDAGYCWCYYFEIPKNKEQASVTRGELARDKYWPKYYKEEDMTREETQKMIDEAVAKCEPKERVYHYWSEIKKDAPWAYAPLKALYDYGVFAGASPADLNIGQTKLECSVEIAAALKKMGVITY